MDHKNKQLKFHVEQDDYFATLATILDLLRQELEKSKKNITRGRQIKLLEKLKNDLMFLQKNYKIIEK